MSGMAQNESTPQDTTLYVNGRKIVIKEQGDKIKVKLYESASGGDTITNAQIFEGVYLNGQSTESRTVLSALPFSKKNAEVEIAQTAFAVLCRLFTVQ